MEACFNARFRVQGAGCEAPGTQEFITKAIGELQEARAMRGERHPTSLSAAAAPDMGGELRVCVNMPRLNRAASGRPALAGVGAALTAMSECRSAC